MNQRKEFIEVEEKDKKRRLILLFCICLLWILLVSQRLLNLQILDIDQLNSWALRQHNSALKVAGQRGPILDRKGKLLAVSVPAGSIYIRPKLIKDKAFAIKSLKSVVDISEESLIEKINSKQPFVWIKRQIPKVQAEVVRDFKIKGIDYITESKRYYPLNDSASRIIGRVGYDGIGLSGLEAKFEDQLSSKIFNQKFKRDALGNSISVMHKQSEVDDINGRGVVLTIDSEIQLIMDSVIKKTHVNSKADKVMAVMADAETGEILALSQTPNVNFNSSNRLTVEDLKNPIIEEVFEPGSTLKPFVIAAALDHGLVDTKEIFDCSRNSFKIGRKIIKDVHFYPTLNLEGVLVRSSNIGMSRIGLRFSKDKLYNSLRKFGFGERISLGLPGASGGILRKPRTWAEIDLATHSFGQGVAVTSLQMLRAVSSIVNGGALPQLNLIRNNSIDSKNKRILTQETSLLVKEMMVKVVNSDHGTGKRARIENVIIGGKTGTAQKASPTGGYYKDKYIASFLGFADLVPNGLNRKLSLFVVVDEPKNGDIYGGVLAAPAFKEIVEKTIRLLQLRKVFEVKSKSLAEA